jgi:hypothetical protein
MLIHLIKRETIRPLRGRRKVDVGFALLHRRQGHAGEDARPVDMHGACTAFAAIACEIPDIRAEQAVAEGVVRVPVRPTVNGQLYTIVIEPRMTLLDAWREELGLTGTKKAFSVLAPVITVPVLSRSLRLLMFLILHTCVIGAMSRLRPPVTLSRPAKKMRCVCDTTCRIAAKKQTV